MNENKFLKYITEENPPEDVQEKIMDFLRVNPNPNDEAIHNLSDELGIETDKFESYVYNILGDVLGYGRALEKGITAKDVDAKQLAMGIKVEMEHTNNKVLASRISLDHLAEHNNSDYYTRLLKMEKEMTEELGERG